MRIVSVEAPGISDIETNKAVGHSNGAFTRFWGKVKGVATTCLLLVPALVAVPSAAAQGGNVKKDVALWYEAFSTDNPALLEKVLHETWTDIPSPPEMPVGAAGAKLVLSQLRTAFPDLHLAIEDVLQDGNKVVVRARMTGTQQGTFMGSTPTSRKLDIQVVDIHEFKDGKILRTWHTEDWMSGLRQLGILKGSP